VHGFKGERTLMRIHIGERDKYHGRPLYQAIVELLRGKHYAGATTSRGIMGFGASSKLHADRVEVLSIDLPIVIECVDTEERIQAILPQLDEMLGGGLITLERAKVIMYRPDLRRHERTASHEIDVTGRWQPDGPAQP
jgi:PII-like signaling protein